MTTLLNEIIAAHGGLQRWGELQELKLQVNVGGPLFAMKFKSSLLHSFECIVFPHQIGSLLKPFPQSGQVGIFDANSVRIENEDGTVVAYREIKRDSQGKVYRRRIWDDLDVLYFLGYALWNYTVTPYVFLWPGFEYAEGKEWREDDRTKWRTLCVRYPLNFPTHCREQTFYFDDQGLLRRLDYTADVVSNLARGAHLCQAHRSFDGLVFPTYRIVHPRGPSGRPITVIKVIEGWINDVKMTWQSSVAREL